MPPYRNQLLRQLSPSDLALILPGLVSYPLDVGADVEVPSAKVSHVYFPESGIVSIVASMPPSRDIEVGIVGRDGMIGGAVLLGDNLAVHKVFVQIAGTAHSLPVETLLGAAADSPTIRSLLLRYLRAFGLQVSGTAFANGQSNLEARLARWLLMCIDRVDSNTLELTHEFLSVMIGVRRSGVTLALQVLEGERAVTATRGKITVRNRDGCCWNALTAVMGSPRLKYERLLGEQVVSALVV